MAGAGPVLLEVFWRLDRAFRSRPFSGAEAAPVLTASADQRNLRLARLCQARWLARIGRTRYVALGPYWARPGVRDGLAELRHRSFYPELAVTISGVFRTYGPRLRSIALYGSCARGADTPDSDLDLLIVAEPLPERLGARIDETRPIAMALAEFERTERRVARRVLLPQLIVLTPAELEGEPPLLLDLTEDARLIFDPEGVLQSVLGRLATKLRRLGSRRVRTAEGWTYWVLRPGARLGEIGPV